MSDQRSQWEKNEEEKELKELKDHAVKLLARVDYNLQKNPREAKIILDEDTIERIKIVSERIDRILRGFWRGG